MAYCTVEELREAGVSSTEYPEDSYLQERIDIASEFIDMYTQRWFDSRNLTLWLDGTGNKFLPLPIPPISSTALSTVKLNDGVLTVDTDYIFRLRVKPDDRWNPLIYMVGGTWRKGYQNVEITGDFGFVEADGSTPVAIKDLCKRLAVWGLPSIGDVSARRENDIVEEQLGDYRYRLSEKVNRGGVFGDPRIDNVLTLYRKRRVMAI